jgi:competence protein ComEA
MDMPQIGRGRALAYLAVVVGALAVGGHLLLSHPSTAGGRLPDPVVPPRAAPSTERDHPALVVHVVGAVRRPGLYRLPAGSRVNDAIRKAGGPTRKAAIELLNLAAPVADGEQVAVPRIGNATSAPLAGASTGAAAPAGPVHLNTATLEQLDALPGVGPVTAQKILDYRAQHGAFTSVDELDAIPGIGPSRLDQLRKLVVP